MATTAQPRPLTDAEYAALTRKQRIALGLDEDDSGAPADFNGTVLPNPNHLKPALDTDSGIQPTRLPNGVNFNRGNFNGKMPGDISNPAASQMLPSAMREVGADMSAQPTSLPPLPKGYSLDQASASSALPPLPKGYTLDSGSSEKPDSPSLLNRLATDANDIPLDSYTHATERGLANIGQGVAQAAQSAGQLIRHPIDSITGMVKSAAELPSQTAALVKSPPTLGEVGDVAGVVGGNLAAGVIGGEATGAATSRMPAMAKLTQARVQAIRDAAQSPTGQAVTAAAKRLPAAAIRRIPYVGDVAADVYDAARKARPLDATSENVPFAGEVEPPATRTLQELNGTASPKPPSTTPQAVQQTLNDALGGRPLQKNVPLRQQLPALQKSATTTSNLPQGFTPVDSSALSGYKYDAATREFQSITKDGRHYIHGDVSPEEAQAFAEAQSKGKAWQQIRGQNPLVAKVVNGTRVATKPPSAMGSALPEGVPRYVYRARDAGEEGVPLTDANASATSSPGQATQFAEPGQRSPTQGQVVRIDLSKLKPEDYVIKQHPDGMSWVQFTRPLTEAEVEHWSGAAKNAGK